MSTSIRLAQAVAIRPGSATGEALVLRAPLDVVAGLDPETGRITQVDHPDHGQYVVGRILVVPGLVDAAGGGGSLDDATAAGNGPLALLLGNDESNLANKISCLVAPIVGVPPVLCAGLRNGQVIDIAVEASSAQLTVHEGHSG